MIPVFTFTIVIVLYLYVIVKMLDTGASAFWTFIWGLATYSLIGSFMWWVFT